jgi:hypothetical protein
LTVGLDAMSEAVGTGWLPADFPPQLAVIHAAATAMIGTRSRITSHPFLLFICRFGDHRWRFFDSPKILGRRPLLGGTLCKDLASSLPANSPTDPLTR